VGGAELAERFACGSTIRPVRPRGPVAFSVVTGELSLAAEVPTEGAPRESRRRERWPYWLPAGTVIVGLVVTAILASVSYALYTNNEQRLLDLRLRELGSVLTEALPNVQTPLASAAALGNATNGDVRKFMRFVAPYVGAPPSHQFVSISLWRLGPGQRRPLAAVGAQPALAASPSLAQGFLARASRSAKLAVIGLRTPTLSRLGYAATNSQPPSRFAAYGESSLPPDRRSQLQSNSAFSELDYALYLSRSQRTSDLLVTSLSHPPIVGRRAQERIPFGDTELTLVVAPRQPLGGTFPQRLPWIVGIMGLLLTGAAAASTMWLVRRRRGAEHLADRLEIAVAENERLYAEQRTIAQTLQHALLPEQLPRIAGAEASARYEPGEQGVEIGGDWYDVIPLDDNRVLLVVGDVSGRGLRAAATMASLRYAIHAYAAQGDEPGTILTKLNKLVSVKSSGQLATVLCVMVDPDAHELRVTSAGHLPPLLMSDGRGEFVKTEVGLPIGVDRYAAYTSSTVTVPPGATLLAFTDGLVERRGESIDVGLGRLREHATSNHATLDELLTRVVSNLRQDGADDDTAIAGIRWLS
jgi:serine phosphatase RsbU (regulator of sigma subunit)